MVLMDIKENIQDIESMIAMIEVSSSMMLFSALLLICNDVKTKRQNPSRFAAVFKMWGEVLLDMEQR